MKAIKVIVGDEGMMLIPEIIKQIMEDEECFAYQTSKNEFIFCSEDGYLISYWRGVLLKFNFEIIILDLK